MITHIRPLELNSCSKVPIFENARWRLKPVLTQLIAITLQLLTDFDEIWHGDVHWPYQPNWLLKV